MSQELEDVKPKLNLNITYDGTREALFRIFTFDYYSLNGIVITYRYHCKGEVEYEICKDL